MQAAPYHTVLGQIVSEFKPLLLWQAGGEGRHVDGCWHAVMCMRKGPSEQAASTYWVSITSTQLTKSPLRCLIEAPLGLEM